MVLAILFATTVPNLFVLVGCFSFRHRHAIPCSLFSQPAFLAAAFGAAAFFSRGLLRRRLFRRSAFAAAFAGLGTGFAAGVAACAPDSRSRCSMVSIRARSLRSVAQLLHAVRLPHRHLEAQPEHLLRRLRAIAWSSSAASSARAFSAFSFMRPRYSSQFPRDELGRQADLRRRQPHRRRRQFLGHAFHLKQNLAGPHHRTPTDPARLCLYPYGFQPASW